MKISAVTFSVLLALLLAFTGCGGGKKGGGEAGDAGLKLKETGKDGTLTFMMWGTPEEKLSVYKVLQAFQKKNDIGLKVIHTDSLSFGDKLKTMIAGNATPDVFYLDRPYFYGLASSGKLKNLDEYITDEEFKADDIYPVLMDAFKFGGSLYGIPKDWTTFVLYYNKDMFDKAGLPYPNSNWTWTDFTNAAVKLTIKDVASGRPSQYGFIMETWADWYYNWIVQNNGSIFDKDGKWVFADGKYLNQNAEALQYLSDLIKANIAPDPATSKQLGGSAAFISGQAAMCMYGRWVMLDFKRINRFKWDYTVLPRNKSRAAAFVTVSLAMSAETKYPDAAWKLIKFITSFEGQINTAEAGMAIPARMSLVGSDHYLKAPEVIANQPHLAKAKAEDDPFIQSMPYMVPIPVGPNWIEVRQKLDEQLENVFLGLKDAKSTILSIDNLVKEILNAKTQKAEVGDEE